MAGIDAVASDTSATAAPRAFVDEQLSPGVFEDRALRALVELLVDLELGARLPSERELTQRLSVSRNTLRDRIAKLESLGVLERRERQGTFYVGLLPEQAGGMLVLGLMLHQMTFESLISVRHALERQAAVEACRSITAAHSTALWASIVKMQPTASSEELLEADAEFHRALFAASESQALLFFSQMLNSVLHGTLRKLTLDQDIEKMLRVHVDILRAVENRDEAAASNAMDDHFAWLHVLRARELRGEL